MNGWALQKAVYERLSAYTGLTDLLAADPAFADTPAVYDHVPQEAAYPYVVIGDDYPLEWDTDTTTGTDTEMTIHVWSRFRGRKETKQIQDAIYAALHRHELVVDGAHTVSIEFEDARSFVEDDGLTRHGVISVRALLENA